VKAIIVGLGGWGSSWAQVIRDSPDWEIAAWVDVNPHALENAVANLAADPKLCFPTLKEAVEKVSADAAFIITPPMCGRLADVTTALDAGLHVLAEKPLTDSLEDARLMLDRHKGTQLKFMVAQNYRFFAASTHMRDAVRSSQGLLFTDHGSLFTGLDPLGYANVLYHMAVNAPGIHAADMENGFVLSMCIHHLDTMRFVFGEPECIRAQTWNPPWSWSKSDACVSALITFLGDVKVNYFAGWAARRNETDWYGHWDLQFENGALFTDGSKVYTITGDEKVEIPGPGSNTQNTRLDVLNEFTSAIREDRTPACSIEDNTKTLEMAFSIIQSARKA
jgi:predicted dehydrogenase